MWLKLIGQLKTSKWLIYSLASFAVVMLTLVVRALFTSPGDKDHAKYVLPPAPKALQDAVDKAEEDALKTKVQAAATTDAHTDQLAKIASNPDGVERRKQMAELLNSIS